MSDGDLLATIQPCGINGGRTAQRNIVVVVELVDGVDFATDVEFLGGLVQVLDGWVLGITTEDQLALLGPLIRKVTLAESDKYSMTSFIAKMGRVGIEVPGVVLFPRVILSFSSWVVPKAIYHTALLVRPSIQAALKIFSCRNFRHLNQQKATLAAF